MRHFAGLCGPNQGIGEVSCLSVCTVAAIGAAADKLFIISSSKAFSVNTLRNKSKPASGVLENVNIGVSGIVGQGRVFV